MQPLVSTYVLYCRIIIGWSRNIIIIANGIPLIPFPFITKEVMIVIFFHYCIISIRKCDILYITIVTLITQDRRISFIVLWCINDYRISNRPFLLSCNIIARNVVSLPSCYWTIGLALADLLLLLIRISSISVTKQHISSSALKQYYFNSLLTAFEEVTYFKKFPASKSDT